MRDQRDRAGFMLAGTTDDNVLAMKRFHGKYRRLRGVDLFHDGGPGHASLTTTHDRAAGRGWWRPRLSPARATWLGEAGFFNHAFDLRYLKRGSWSRRQTCVERVEASWSEYN
jgi:hypothetical protein